jgi:hypothetical protein
MMFQFARTKTIALFCILVLFVQISGTFLKNDVDRDRELGVLGWLQYSQKN